jgi:hypothetical protein
MLLIYKQLKINIIGLHINSIVRFKYFTQSDKSVLVLANDFEKRSNIASEYLNC